MNYYKSKYPKKDQLIVCKVRKHNDSTVELKALEYEETNPYVFILYSEVTKKKRVYSTKNLIKIGEIDVFEVFDLDIIKNTIEVSKKNISIEEKNKKMDEYLAETKAFNIVKYFMKLFNLEKEYINSLIEVYITPLNLINAISNNIDILEKLNEEEKGKVKELIEHHYAEKELIVRTDFELNYFGSEGIDAIKESIKCGINLATNDIPISIRYLSAPTYTIQSKVLKKNKEIAEDLHCKVCEAIEEKLKTFSGLGKFKSLGLIEHKVEKEQSDSLDSETEDSGDEEDESEEEGYMGKIKDI